MTTANISQHPRCPRCGAAVQGNGPCPACLISGAMATAPGGEETVPGPAPAAGEPEATRADGDAGAPRHPRPHLEPPCDFGGYRLLRFLGRGGMGTVYEAEHLTTGRRVALKMLEQQLDSPDMRKRFLREGRLAARVNHPHTLYIFGSEEIEGLPVITMEVAAAGTLRDVLKQRGPLPAPEAVAPVSD